MADLLQVGNDTPDTPGMAGTSEVTDPYFKQRLDIAIERFMANLDGYGFPAEVRDGLRQYFAAIVANEFAFFIWVMEQAKTTREELDINVAEVEAKLAATRDQLERALGLVQERLQETLHGGMGTR